MTATTGAARPGPRAWARFTAAPHRVFFFCGGLTLVLSVAFWLLDAYLLFHDGRTLMANGVNDIYAHGVLMGLGIFPYFMFGFLFTTFPRWLDQPGISRRWYLSVALLMMAGTAALWIGLVRGSAWPNVGLALYGLGWALGLARLARTLLGARKAVLHAWVVWPALLAGDLLVLFLAIQPSPLDGRFSALPFLAIWWCLLPVFMAVCHRMVPFFSQNKVTHLGGDYRLHRPAAWLIGTVLLFAVRPLLAGRPAAEAGVDIALTVLTGGIWLAWQPWKCLQDRLLAVLHIGFAWAWVGLLLSALSDIMSIAGQGPLLWRGALHAIALGFFGSILMAMVTRVTLGHSGRPLSLRGGTWALFWLVQLAAVMRVLAGWPQLGFALGGSLVAISGLLWFGAFAAWVLIFGRIYWQARRDGAPG